MKQEEKELLLKDLCARLLDKVVTQVSYKDGEGWKTENRRILGVYTDGQVYVDCVYTSIENIKPYLRPLSSITEEEKTEFFQLMGNGTDLQRIDFYLSHYFDFRGLITTGLALEAPKNMYK